MTELGLEVANKTCMCVLSCSHVHITHSASLKGQWLEIVTFYMSKQNCTYIIIPKISVFM